MLFLAVSVAGAATCLVIAAVFVRQQNVHVINGVAQTIASRGAVVLAATALLFLAQFGLDEPTSSSSSQSDDNFTSLAVVVVAATTALLESMLVLSIYFLVVVQVGGTERAIDVLAKRLPCAD
ncbi:hypothetical protein As57867_018894, partial [Aphanomyces stellatus]